MKPNYKLRRVTVTAMAVTWIIALTLIVTWHYPNGLLLPAITIYVGVPAWFAYKFGDLSAWEE